MRIISIRESLPSASAARDSRRALEGHRSLLRAALSAANVFSWVFIFEFFYVSSGDIAYAFAQTALLYALCQVVICLSTPLSASLLAFGARRALAGATLLSASAFVVLGATLEAVWGLPLISAGLVAFAALLGFYRALYWLPYDVEQEETGASKGNIIRELAIALVPCIAGFLLVQTTGPTWLLFGIAALAAASILPLMGLRDVREKFPWSYRATFAQWMAPENHVIARQSILEGALGAALLFLWPLAIFFILGESYALLGVVLSITFVFAILGRGLVRGSMRRFRLHHSPLVNAVLVMSPWLLRLGVATPLGIVLVDSYFYTTTPRRLGMDPVAFEQSSDGGFFMDEFTPIKEMGLALGRLAMGGIAAALALLVSIPVALLGVFALAALLSIWASR